VPIHSGQMRARRWHGCTVTFTRFALPVLPTRRWDLLILGLIFAVLFGVDRGLGLGLGEWLSVEKGHTLRQPWRLVLYVLVQADPWKAVGVAIAVPVGLNMVVRSSGGWVAWGGALGGTLIGGLLAWWWQEVPLLGASSLLYTALGMATVAWWRMRDELTYARRVDWIAGFATLGLVAAALALPLVLDQPFHAEYLATALFGGAVVAFAPRHYVTVMR
jgi:hypothetical protein